MIVVCEKCGKNYEIDPEHISGEIVRFRCESCNEVITVSKLEDSFMDLAAPLTALEEIPEPKKKAVALKIPFTFERLGLRGKMSSSFSLFPSPLSSPQACSISGS